MTTEQTSVDMRANSKTLYDGNSRAGARAMMKSIGFSDDDLRKPITTLAVFAGVLVQDAGLRVLVEVVEGLDVPAGEGFGTFLGVLLGRWGHCRQACGGLGGRAGPIGG